MAQTFENAGVWHSQLRDASATQPLPIRFTSEVRASKYAGKPPYIEFTVEGDPKKYKYQIGDNPVEIHRLLDTIQQGELYQVQALDSKESAQLVCTPASGVPVATPPEAAPAAAPPAAPPAAPAAAVHPNAPGGQAPPPPEDLFEYRGPASNGNGNGKPATNGKCSLARQMYQCLEAGAAVIEQFAQKHGRPPSEEERAMGISFFIELQRSYGQKSLTGDK